MKKAILIGWALLTGAVTYAAVTSEQRIERDAVLIGRPTPAADPEIKFKGTTQKIKANRTTNKLQFSNDGSIYKNLGSGSGGGGSGVNLLAELNGDFEDGDTQWTESGGTFTIDTATPLFGTNSGSWDASASSQTLDSTAATINRGMIGRSCFASVNYSYVGATGDYKFQVRDTGTLVTEIDLVALASGLSSKAVLYFDCPDTATDTLQVRIIANVADPAVIKLDNVFIGSDSTFFAKPQDVFSAKISDTDVVSSENIDWINGNCTDAASGDATCVFKAGIFAQAPNCTCSPNEAAASGQCRVAAVSATQVTFHTNDNSGASVNDNMFVSCQKVESSANRETISLETVGSSWSGYHDSTCSWARTNTAYGDPTADATCALGERQNSNFGTVTSVAGLLPGITFTPKTTGNYFVCASFTTLIATAGADIGARLWDGATVVDESGYEGPNAGNNIAIKLCGIYYVNSTSSKTLSIQTKASAGAATIQALTNTTAIEWSIFPISQNFPAPVFNDIRNKADGGEPGVKICTWATSGAATVLRATGNCGSGVGAGVGVGTGRYDYVPNVFTVAPSCTCAVISASAGQHCHFVSDPTTSLVQVITSNATPAAANAGHMLTCIGK